MFAKITTMTCGTTRTGFVAFSARHPREDKAKAPSRLDAMPAKAMQAVHTPQKGMRKLCAHRSSDKPRWRTEALSISVRRGCGESAIAGEPSPTGGRLWQVGDVMVACFRKQKAFAQAPYRHGAFGGFWVGCVCGPLRK